MLIAPRLGGTKDFLTYEGLEAAKAYVMARSIKDVQTLSEQLWSKLHNWGGNGFIQDRVIEQRIVMYEFMTIMIPIAVGSLRGLLLPPYFARVYLRDDREIYIVENPKQILAYILAKFW